MDNFNVVQYKEFLGEDTLFTRRKHGNLNAKVATLAHNVSLEEAITTYQSRKHREGLSYNEWLTTIKIEYNTELLNKD